MATGLKMLQFCVKGETVTKVGGSLAPNSGEVTGRAPGSQAVEGDDRRRRRGRARVPGEIWASMGAACG